MNSKIIVGKLDGVKDANTIKNVNVKINAPKNIMKNLVEDVYKYSNVVLLSNLEKVFLCYCDETEKKLEMLRENNNLFATEIQKLGGFKENDDFNDEFKEEVEE